MGTLSLYLSRVFLLDLVPELQYPEHYKRIMQQLTNYSALQFTHIDNHGSDMVPIID